MKIIDKDSIVKGQTDRLFEEIEILIKLEHPNITKIYEYYNCKNNIYIISEYLDDGTLLDKLRELYSFSELIIKYLMSQILDEIKYLQKNSVFHGNIKLENIMLFSTSSKRGKRFTILNEEINSNSNLQNEIENNYKGNSDYTYEILKYEIKLIDFGCSKYLNKKKDNELSGIVGTNIYTP